MIKIEIKALSVNECYTGKRYKTEEYRVFEKEMLLRLPGGKYSMYKDCNLKVMYEVGFSNKGADLGNVEKIISDILQKKYGFNDNRIYEIVLIKKIVPLGHEYITLNIIPLYD